MARRKKKKKSITKGKGPTSSTTTDERSRASPTVRTTETANDASEHIIARSIRPIVKALAEMTTYPDHNLDQECPVCLHPLDIIAAVRLLCCGGLCCKNCVKEKESYVTRSIVKKKVRCNAADVQLLCHCLLCRQIVPRPEEEESVLLAYAAKGTPWAQWELGRRHLFGSRTIARRSVYLGHELLMRAAKQGFPLALNTLGNCYIIGIGCVDRSIQNAKYCFEKALEQGYEPARSKLSTINEREKNTKVLARIPIPDGFDPDTSSLEIINTPRGATISIDFVAQEKGTGESSSNELV